MLNIFTVLYTNRPVNLVNPVFQRLSHSFSPQTAYQFRLGAWLIERYAYLAGLDNRWVMFSWHNRFNWWNVITAQYGKGPAESKRIVLPLAFQSPRTFWQQLQDFKEAKFHLNIYNDPIGREAYSRYLCRQYPVHDDQPVEAITFERHYQIILEPAQARLYKTHLHPTKASYILNTFPCPNR